MALLPLALCHVLPRDSVLRLCALLLLAALVNLILTICLASTKEHGSVEIMSSGLKLAEVRYDRMRNITTATRMCDRAMRQKNNDCDDFVTLSTTSAVLYIAGAVSVFVSLPLCAAITAYAEKCTRLMCFWFINVLIPTLICVAAECVGAFAVGSAKKLVAVQVGLDSGALRYRRLSGGNLALTSTIMVGAAFLCSVIRVVIFIIIHPSRKRHHMEEHDVLGIVEHRVVNDDVLRQGQILRMHVDEVERHFQMKRIKESTNSAPAATAVHPTEPTAGEEPSAPQQA